MEQVLLVMTTMPDVQSAQHLARQLVAQKLVACVNCLPAVRSIYRWQNTIEEADETMLFMKTNQQRYPALEAAIKLAHPYDLPEVAAIPLSTGLPAYLQWVVAETRSDENG